MPRLVRLIGLLVSSLLLPARALARAFKKLVPQSGSKPRLAKVLNGSGLVFRVLSPRIKKGLSRLRP
jgi:hypothetical protein